MSIIETSGNNVSNWIHSLFQEKSSFGTILVDCSAKMDIGENTNYNNFRLKGTYSDVVLESNEGVQFPAHRIVLGKQTIYVSFCENIKYISLISITKLFRFFTSYSVSKKLAGFTN